MKALSIRQPWASLIADGYKDIENRSWTTNFRGRIYIHASQRYDDGALSWIKDRGLLTAKELVLYNREIAAGGIIGEVNIVECVTSSSSPWFVGPYGFVLSNPVRYKSLTPCKGRLGFFEPKVKA